MAYTEDLKSSAEKHKGSSPFSGTIKYSLRCDKCGRFTKFEDIIIDEWATLDIEGEVNIHDFYTCKRCF